MQEPINQRRRAARKRASEVYSERRAEVLRAAAEVFRRRGFNGTSMGAIARETGMSRAGLYYYLSDKRELYREVVSGAVEANVAELIAIRDSANEPARKIRRAVLALMRSFDESYPFMQVYVQEPVPTASGQWSGWARQMRVLGRRYDESMITIIEEGMARGIFHSQLSAKFIAHGIVGMLNWTCRWYKPGQEPGWEAIADGFAHVLLDGLTRTEKSNLSRLLSSPSE
jgi:AcrR family transcriptional regulator